MFLSEIFISHSSKDAKLIDALVQLIEGGIGSEATKYSALRWTTKGFRRESILRPIYRGNSSGQKSLLRLCPPDITQAPFACASWARHGRS